MALWTSDYATGIAICAVCGAPKDKRTSCCKTSPRVTFESFVRALWPGYTMTDPASEHYVPRAIAREFYDDYLHSDYPSLKAYVESR